MNAPTRSLAQKTARGVVWVFTLRVADRGLAFVRMIILARLLAPDDFGVMGIALLMLSGLEVMTLTGFGAALIQKKGSITPYLDSAWTAQLIRGFLLFAALFLAAPLIASFFREPHVTTILRVVAISELIKGLQNIGTVYFDKDLEFHRAFLYRFSSTVVTLAVSIPLALILRDAMALALGVVAGETVSCLMSYVVHPYRPRISLDWARMGELFGYGKWILGTSFLTFLCNQGDDVFLGRMLGAGTLGLYQMAYMISNLPATEITHVVMRVAFPAYAKLQDNPAGLREMHLAVIRLIALLSVPLAAGIVCLSEDFTMLFLGARWEPMVPALQLLALWGLMRSVGAPVGALLQGSGSPYIGTRAHAVKFVLLCLCIYPMTRLWGMKGAALAVVLHTLPIEVFVHYFTIRMLKCPATLYLKSLAFPVVASVAMYFAVSLAREQLSGPTSVVTFMALIAVGIVSYVCVIGILEQWFHYGLRDIVARLTVKPVREGAHA